MAKKPSDETAAPPRGSDEEQFRLTTGWVIAGVLFVALGIALGLVMSSATLVR